MDGTPHGNPGPSRGVGRPDGRPDAAGGPPRFTGNAGDARKGRGRRGKAKPPSNPGQVPKPLENAGAAVGDVEDDEEEDGEVYEEDGFTADLPEVAVVHPPGTTHITGTCVLMCPPSERDFRSRKNDIELFERPVGGERNASDETLAVKKYTRIVDNVTPDMVRTKPALAMTASYLYGLLDQRPEVHFMIKSKFL